MSKKISKEEFEKITKKYQKKNEGKTRAVTFDRATFERILANPETAEIAVYFAENDEGKDTAAVIGVNKSSALLYETAENLGGLCPPLCHD